ncbi:hypothetical protein TRSC58_07549 [Trypanosoma rangeli SC58]|uniref:Uncharacterized protein n=1 Tax=Trypanosoma rangeli SC58 TaxID=429131 RepID=A0A061ISX8_TRYRA|nr:hypothetical protein TRSC58_07549 [Trypanosoma rangeli SC58]
MEASFPAFCVFQRRTQKEEKNKNKKRKKKETRDTGRNKGKSAVHRRVHVDSVRGSILSLHLRAIHILSFAFSATPWLGGGIRGGCQSCA